METCLAFENLNTYTISFLLNLTSAPEFDICLLLLI